MSKKETDSSQALQQAESASSDYEDVIYSPYTQQIVEKQVQVGGIRIRRILKETFVELIH